MNAINMIIIRLKYLSHWLEKSLAKFRGSFWQILNYLAYLQQKKSMVFCNLNLVADWRPQLPFEGPTFYSFVKFVKKKRERKKSRIIARQQNSVKLIVSWQWSMASILEASEEFTRMFIDRLIAYRSDRPMIVIGNSHVQPLSTACFWWSVNHALKFYNIYLRNL